MGAIAPDDAVGATAPDDAVGASIPPTYQFDPINSIYVCDDSSSRYDHLLDGGSAVMTKVSDKLYQYTFKDLVPNRQYRFHFCVNDHLYDRFARAADTTDYGFDASVRVFRYPPGFNPPSNEINLTENNIMIPPDGYLYDVTVSLDLTYYDENDPGNVYGYAEYTLTAQRKYPIKTEADWNTFCDRLLDNETYNRFSGETVSLENDITVSRQAGGDQHDFCGIFDGKGHTLTFDYSGNGSDNYVAPFHFVSVTAPAGSEEGAPVAPVTIKNLNVKSKIRGSGTHAAGLIGQCWGTVNVENCTMDIDIDTGKEYAAGYVGKNSATINFSGCTVGGTIKTSAKFGAGFVAETSGVCNITDCLSALTINSSIEGDGTHAGFISVQNKTNGGNITMKGCAFTGSLLGDKTNSCGGFIGWRTKGLTIYDSIFAPESVTILDDDSAMFARNLGDTYNSYYLYAFGTDSGNQWKQGYKVSAGENTSVELGGTIIEYKTSKIKSSGYGIQYNQAVYAGEGDNVFLTLGETHELGMICGSYTTDNGTLTGNENPYTLAMPAAEVIVTAHFIPTPYTVGDVNRDMFTNINDVTMIQMYFAELITLDNDQLALANTNGDTVLNLDDATHLQKFLADFEGVMLAEELTPPIIEPPTEPSVEKTVRFIDNMNWGFVYLCAYNSESDSISGQWPGTRITQTEKNEFDETVFIFTIPAEAEWFVLSNGADEITENITNFDVDGYYLDDKDKQGRYVVGWWKEDE